QRGILREVALTECPVCVRGQVRTGKRQDYANSGPKVARADGAFEDAERRVRALRARDRTRLILHEEERSARPGEPPEEARREIAVGEVHQDEGRGEAPLHLQSMVGQIGHDWAKPHSLHALTDTGVISEDKGDGFARHLSAPIVSRFGPRQAGLKRAWARPTSSLGRRVAPETDPALEAKV